MAPTPGNRVLLELYREVSHDLGLGDVKELDPFYRGAADISHVAAYADALDGLGGWGRNNHKVDERLELYSLAIATKRAALLMYRLTR